MKSVDPDRVFATLGHKLATVFPGNKDLKEPLPIINSQIFLVSTCTGLLKTSVEANAVTAWRTAGASMVGTKYLYFDRNEQAKGDKVLAVLGCGVQVMTQKCYESTDENSLLTPSIFSSIRDVFMLLESLQCSE